MGEDPASLRGLPGSLLGLVLGRECRSWVAGVFGMNGRETEPASVAVGVAATALMLGPFRGCVKVPAGLLDSQHDPRR